MLTQDGALHGTSSTMAALFLILLSLASWWDIHPLANYPLCACHPICITSMVKIHMQQTSH